MQPFFQQHELHALTDETGTALKCWYQLGHGDASLLGHPTIVELAQKYGKDTDQIVLRFETQGGLVTLPKFTNPARIKGNLNVFDFVLTDAEMDSMRALDTGRDTHDPDDPANEEPLLFFHVHE